MGLGVKRALHVRKHAWCKYVPVRCHGIGSACHEWGARRPVCVCVRVTHAVM